jgi:hypothetical protein
MAGFIKVAPTKSWELLSMNDSEFVVTSDGPRMGYVFIKSTPFTREMLQSIRQLQLETVSHDQGWPCGPGTWTWFEIVIFTPLKKVDPGEGKTINSP